MVVCLRSGLVVQQAVAIVLIADEQVDPAVVVKIGRGNAHCWPHVTGSAARADAAKGAIAIVVEEWVGGQTTVIGGGHHGQV